MCAAEGAVAVALAEDCSNMKDWPYEGNVDRVSVWALSYADMTVMDTIADVVVGNAGEEGRVAGSHDKTGDGAPDAEDDRRRVAFARFEVESQVRCSSRLGRRAAPNGHSRLLKERNPLWKWTSIFEVDL